MQAMLHQLVPAAAMAAFAYALTDKGLLHAHSTRTSLFVATHRHALCATSFPPVSLLLQPPTPHPTHTHRRVCC
jgi:hypothetical protein